ncbi:hypothetical protein CH70_1988 (plasmid) [Francisella tularensis subsp. novicida]|nr:hypothetical protein CH70_1988 [Francisella tularensis subsp. novicida]
MIDQLILTFCRIDDFCIIYHKKSVDLISMYHKNSSHPGA